MNRFLLAAVIALAFVACSRRTSPTSGPYPPTDPRYPNPGETRYPAPYPSEDNSTTYPTEGQRDGVVTIIRTGGGNQENLPPGQAKKKYGGQSAKVYAPGQRKKNGGAGQGRIATVISVPDMYASRTTTGQLYYNYRGNTYWKQGDGYYHLQGQNNTTATNDNGQYKKNKGKGKNKNKQNDDNDD